MPLQQDMFLLDASALNIQGELHSGVPVYQSMLLCMCRVLRYVRVCL